MVKGKLGLPRPLLNEECSLRITAENTGRQTENDLLEAIKHAGEGYSFTITSSGTIDHGAGIPDSVFVDVGNNRVTLNQLGEVAYSFSKATGKTEDEISLNVTGKVTIDSIRPAIFTESSGEPRMVIEVVPSQEPSLEDLATIQGVNDSFIDAVFVDGGVLIETNYISIPLTTLDDLGMEIIDIGLGYESIAVTCDIVETGI